MMRCILGDGAFFGGLKNYLEKFKYSNPTTDDLFEAWDDYILTNNVIIDNSYVSNTNPLCDGLGHSWNKPVLPATFKETFTPWVRQMGFPFLRVRYTENQTLTITQKRFLNNPDQNIEDPPSSFNYRWNIPLFLMVKNGNSMQYATHWLMSSKTEETVELRSATTHDLQA